MNRMNRIAFKFACLFWFLRLERLGNHFEDVATAGKPLIGRWHR